MSEKQTSNMLAILWAVVGVAFTVCGWFCVSLINDVKDGQKNLSEKVEQALSTMKLHEWRLSKVEDTVEKYMLKKNVEETKEEFAQPGYLEPVGQP